MRGPSDFSNWSPLSWIMGIISALLLATIGLLGNMMLGEITEHANDIKSISRELSSNAWKLDRISTVENACWELRDDVSKLAHRINRLEYVMSHKVTKPKDHTYDDLPD